MTKNFHSVSTVARMFDVPPKHISRLLYDRKLRDDVCPMEAGRRAIPDWYLGEVERVLREHGYIADKQTTNA